MIQPLYDAGVMQYSYDRDAFFRIREHSLAHYVSAEFEQGPWSGNAGVRAVVTNQLASAYREDRLLDERNHYRDYLPCLNLSYRASPEIVLRAALAQMMARPNFKDLSPGIIVDPTSGSGSVGNPQLAPIAPTSWT